MITRPPVECPVTFGCLDVYQASIRPARDQHPAHRNDRLDYVHEHRHEGARPLIVRVPATLVTTEPGGYERLIDDCVIVRPRVAVGDSSDKLQIAGSKLRTRKTTL